MNRRRGDWQKAMMEARRAEINGAVRTCEWAQQKSPASNEGGRAQGSSITVLTKLGDL